MIISVKLRHTCDGGHTISATHSINNLDEAKLKAAVIRACAQPHHLLYYICGRRAAPIGMVIEESKPQPLKDVLKKILELAQVSCPTSHLECTHLVHLEQEHTHTLERVRLSAVHVSSRIHPTHTLYSPLCRGSARQWGLNIPRWLRFNRHARGRGGGRATRQAGRCGKVVGAPS